MAIEAASHAALSRLATLPLLFRASVEHVSASHEEYKRCAHEIERRDVQLVLAPAKGVRASALTLPPDPTTVDPWNVDTSTIESATRVPTECPTCNGTKKVTCQLCSGTGSLGCRICGGSGNVSGERGQKKCPNCRGRGKVKCFECTRGQVSCSSCDGAGKTFAHLAITSVTRYAVLHDAQPAPEAHSRLLDVNDFDSEPSIPAHVTDDSGWFCDEVPSKFQPPIDPWHERIVRSRIQNLELPVHEIFYRTALQKGHVRLLGTRFVVARSSDWKPWRVLQAIAIVSGIAVLIAATSIRSAYVNQHAWFSEMGAGDAMVWLILGSVVAGTLATAGLLAGRRAWSLLTAWIPLGVSCICLSALVSLSAIWKPKGDEASQLLDAGNVEAAALTAEAVLVEHDGDSTAFSVLDKIHALRAASSGDFVLESAILNEEWRTKKARDSATDAFRRRAQEEVSQLLRQGDISRLTSLASTLRTNAPDIARTAIQQGHLWQVEQAMKSANFMAAMDHLDRASVAGVAIDVQNRTKARLAAAIDESSAERYQQAKTITDLSARLDELTQISTLLQAHRSLSNLPTTVASDALLREQADVERQREAELARERRAAELLARQREAELARERRAAELLARQREAQERRERRAESPLLCRDGSHSPTCTCGRPRRGCCSHHGGVVGCSAD